MDVGEDDPTRFVRAIRKSGFTIYKPIKVGDPTYWIPAPELEALLDAGLRGFSVRGLKIRTRSKVVKEQVCRVLGYPVPGSFEKTQPRFVGQCFDTYIQKSDNLQIWNEELDPTRRYVVMRVDERDYITQVKVVTGATLARLDTTGTLTQKYQATCIPGKEAAELISPVDTKLLEPFTVADLHLGNVASPLQYPSDGELLKINTIFNKLKTLVGKSFPDSSSDRNRGASLHRMVCRALGYSSYEDDGSFPDIRNQILEVKLQTSPTIDLGLVTPSSTEAMDVPMINGVQIRHCDARYAIFYGSADGEAVKVSNLILTTGEQFFSRFPRFGGKVLNKKIQIPLPRTFFDR